ncbi:MAG: hypothetical protein ACYCV4_17310 [Dermatophilaceae bacterium]
MPRHQRLGRGAVLLTVLTAALGGLLTTFVLPGVSAATLGTLTSSSLMARTLVAPAITDPFPGKPGSSLAGQLDRLGDAWTVSGGTIVVAPANGVRAKTSGTVYATVPAPGTVNAQVSGDVHLTGTYASFGVLIMAAPSGRPAVTATYTMGWGGRIRLQQVSATGTRTTWAGVTHVGIPTVGFQLTLTYLSGVLTAYVNGVPKVTYTVPVADRAAVEANTGSGFAAFGDHVTTFDNFQAHPR